MEKNNVYYCVHCGRTWKRKPKSGYCTNHCIQIIKKASDIIDTIQYNRFVYSECSLDEPHLKTTIIRVDEDIVPILNLCKEMNIITRWCCIGHNGCQPYLVVDYDEHMYEFIKIAYVNNHYIEVDKNYLFSNENLNHLVLAFYNKYGSKQILAFWLEIIKLILNYKTGGILLPNKIQEKLRNNLF